MELKDAESSCGEVTSGSKPTTTSNERVLLTIGVQVSYSDDICCALGMTDLGEVNATAASLVGARYE